MMGFINAKKSNGTKVFPTFWPPIGLSALPIGHSKAAKVAPQFFRRAIRGWRCVAGAYGTLSTEKQCGKRASKSDDLECPIGNGRLGPGRPASRSGGFPRLRWATATRSGRLLASHALAFGMLRAWLAFPCGGLPLLSRAGLRVPLVRGPARCFFPWTPMDTDGRRLIRIHWCASVAPYERACERLPR